VASQLITQHQLDDTFYVVDLANVVRLFKVWGLEWGVGYSVGGSHSRGDRARHLKAGGVLATCKHANKTT
jgi:hypothetical protein